MSGVGLALGLGADVLFADPRRGHPVAAFGRLAAEIERRGYDDRRLSGVRHVIVAVAPLVAVAVGLHRSLPRPARTVLLAASCWAAFGGTSLAREGVAMHASLAAGDLEAGRDRLSHLCARDPRGLDEDQLVRATVESLAENTSDAAVAPLLWAAVAGPAGVLAYRMINTLDAMVGYRSARYLRFGWASARLDDLVNLVPSRVSALLAVGCAPLVGGSARRAWRVWRRDRHDHPSPNAGQVEAAFAGALDVRLGGTNVYHGRSETRGVLGDGRSPELGDLLRAVRLSRLVTAAAGLLSITLAAGIDARSVRRQRS